MFYQENSSSIIDINLPDNFNLDECHRLYSLFLQAHSNKQGVHIHAQDVERIGTHGIQLLLSAAYTFKEDGIPFYIESPSQELTYSFHILGCNKVAKELGLLE